jgi:hypothetical protein
MAVKLSALRAGAVYLQEDSWYSFLLEAEARLIEKPTSSGFERATFRLVA